MRDIIVTAIILPLVPVCFVRPWVGILVWSWIGYMNPHRLCWGFAHDFPFAELVAVATLAGYPFSRDRFALPRRPEVMLLVTLWALFALSTEFAAIHPNAAWDQFVKVSKILLMTLVTLLLFQDDRKLRVLVWVIAVSIGFFGFKGGIFALLTGGQYQVLGPEDSFIGGNNEIGLAMDMVLPILILLRRQAQQRWLRNLLLLWSVLMVAAIIDTYSRGAFLGLLVVLALLFLKSRSKVIALTALVLVGLAAATLAPEKWFQRMATIETYQQDESANQRLNSWYVAYRLARDHPLLGAGFRPFSTDIYERYLPGYWDRGHDAHSIFFQVLAEHGFTGLALYVALILTTVVNLWRTRRIARRLQLQAIVGYADMMEASIAAYVVTGLFASMSYFDLFYHLVAISVILRVLVEQRATAPVTARAPAGALRAAALWSGAGVPVTGKV